MIVNDTCVGGSVEYLGPTVSCQIVNTLVDVFVETDHPLEVLKSKISSDSNLQGRFRSDLLLLRRIVARLRLRSAVDRPSCCNHCFGRTYFKF
jgi:hypothetical protein